MQIEKPIHRKILERKSLSLKDLPSDIAENINVYNKKVKSNSMNITNEKGDYLLRVEEIEVLDAEICEQLKYFIKGKQTPEPTVEEEEEEDNLDDNYEIDFQPEKVQPVLSIFKRLRG
jgi:hydroxymethylpyrimidine pyrophosphatase-like HAD family hydrolase